MPAASPAVLLLMLTLLHAAVLPIAVPTSVLLRALKCDDHSHQHSHQHLQPLVPSRLYPASAVGMRGGSVGGPDGGASRLPAPSKRFPHGGPYDTWEAAAAFSATRLEWIYTWNATTIADVHRRGLSITSTINANIPDPGTGMLGDPANTFAIGRCENVDGQPLTAPWMRGWSPSTPATGPAWGCVNNPIYREQVAFEFVERVLEAKPDALQHDDPELNAGMVAWNGGDPHTSGCYCEYCMAGFNKALRLTLNATTQHRLSLPTLNYRTFLKNDGANHSAADAELLRRLFVEFQTNSTVKYLADLKAHIAETASRLRLPSPLPFSGNNNGVWQDMYMVFDLAIGELSQLSSNPKDLRQIVVARVPPGKQTVLTMPKWSNATFAYSLQGIANTRWSIAYTYASGSNMLVPWDNYLPTSTSERFYGNKQQFGDLFAFIQENQELFDNMTAVIDPPQSNYQLVHSTPGDSYRFRLPGPGGNSGHLSTFIDPTLAKCQAGCDSFIGCKGIFWSEDDGSVGPLCALLTTLKTTFTTLQGQSYLRNATVPCQTSLLATTTAANVSLLARRSISDSDHPTVVLHVVDWRYGDPSANGCHQTGLNAPVCTGSMHPEYPPIRVKIDGARASQLLRSHAGCSSLHVQLVGPGLAAKSLVPLPCTAGSNETIVTLASPRPWALLVLRMHAQHANSGRA